MNVEIVAIDSLTPDPNNARSHDKGVPELAASLNAFGLLKPLVVWHDVVIAGNGMLEAARSLGWTQIEVHRTPEDWTYEKAQSFALADNRTAELSEWKIPTLTEIRFDLDSKGWVTDLFGFEPLAKLVNFGATNPDDVPDLPEVPKAKLGDLFALGDHRVMCGDATDAKLVAKLMGGGLSDCLWTDPPYGVNYVGKTKDALIIKGDHDAGLLALLTGAFSVADSFLVPGSPFYCAHPAGARSIVFGDALISVGWKIHETLVWVKNAMVLGHADYHYKHEPIYYGWTPGEGRSGRGRHVGTKWYGDHSQTSVLEYDKPSRSESHPTMKPVGLVAQCVANSTALGGIVLDPFGGSGSTLIACEQTGRQCRMMELDPRYVDVIVNRWQDFTGQRAKLIKK